MFLGRYALVTLLFSFGAACTTAFPANSDDDPASFVDTSGGLSGKEEDKEGTFFSDGSTDGLIDDDCPDDSDKIAPGECGCGRPDVDKDGDGVYDCLDSCPDDPDKIEPGICGCKTLDLDGDGDGSFDCVDSCPADPEKTEPGECGCGNLDLDSDGDGTSDCSDLCPRDPDKTEPGQCGCGAPDVMTKVYPDCDGDEVFSSIATTLCDAEQADAFFDCADGEDPDGGWSQVAGTDCDDEDPGLSAGVAWYPDCDGDTVYRSEATYACDRVDADDVFNCADGHDPWGGWSQVAGTDCNDEDSTSYEPSDWYPDCDGDGVYAFVATRACGKAGADVSFDCLDGKDPDGSWSDVAGTDSDDEDPKHHCPEGGQDNDGDLVCERVHSLRDAIGVPNIVVEFELASGTYPLYVDGNYDGGGWLLVGRGRENWRWAESGRGKIAGMSKGLGTKSVFDPVYLPTSVIQELVDNAGVDLTQVEIRIKRAANADGSAYQESRWRSLDRQDWTWLFDTQPYPIKYTVFDSVLGSGGTESVWSTSKQAFATGDDHTKTFTSPNTSSSSEKAFSYGKGVHGDMGLLTFGTFLFCNQLFGCDQAIPYAEVYVRIAPGL